MLLTGGESIPLIVLFAYMTGSTIQLRQNVSLFHWQYSLNNLMYNIIFTGGESIP